jgi:predicted nucleic acid-binding protein
MSFVLDTNVISAARRVEKQAIAFQNFMRDFDVNEAFLSSISIMELRFGIQREKRRDPEFAGDLSRWLDEIVLPEFADRLLSFDVAVALRAGGLPTSEKRPSADAMIAATALEHNLQVVTRNIAHFKALGAPCLDPWRYIPGTEAKKGD